MYNKPKIPFTVDDFSFLKEISLPETKTDTSFEKIAQDDSIEEKINEFLKGHNWSNWSLLSSKGEIDTIKDEHEDVYFLGRKNKRGRKSNNSQARVIHSKKSFDNILRKIQIHYLSFVINFCNDALKMEKFSPGFTFKQIKTEIKRTVNFQHVSELKKFSIGDLLKLDISSKYKNHKMSINKELYDIVKNKSKWLNELFNMKYLELFKYYYNNGEKPLDKIKEVILSTKTKSFYYLIEKNKDSKHELISAIYEVYFN